MTSAAQGNGQSIHAHLTKMILLGAGLLVAALALTLDLSTRRFLIRRFDGELFHRAQGLMALVQQDEKGIEFDFVSEMMPEFESPEGPEYFEIWLEDGNLLARSNSLLDNSLPIDHRSVQAPAYGNFDLGSKQCRLLKLTFYPQIDTDEDDGERVQEAFENNQDHDAQENQAAAGNDRASRGSDHSSNFAEVRKAEPATLLLLRDRGDFDRFLNRLRGLIYMVSAALLALLIVLVRLSLQKGLRPLDDISAQVRTIHPKNLETRIHLSKSVSELNPVIEQLNDLLGRLEAASLRERRFTSDAAHELRTPLAELRTLSEVAERDPGDPVAVREFFGDVHDIAMEMQTLVTNLLELSRCDSGVQSVSLQKIDFGCLVSNLSQRFQLSQRPSIQARIGEAVSLEIISDPVLLEQTLRNLLQNAIVHGTSPGDICLEIASEASHLNFSISNPAPHLTEEDLEHLFERFWQKDPARTSGKNAGLGLSLVESYCQMLGIRLTASLKSGRLGFSLDIPKPTA